MKVPSVITKKKKLFTYVGLLLLVLFSAWVGSRIGSPRDEHDGHDHAAEDAAAGPTVWTCSMHPQIKLPKEGQCPICFMDLIPLKNGGDDTGDGDAVRLSMSQNARVLAGIVSAPVVKRSVNSSVRLTGKVAFDQTRLEMITARIPGRIDRLYVDYVGVPVRKGDHLAQIYSPELVSLQKELLESSRAVDRLGPETSELVRGSVERTFAATKEKVRLLGFSGWEIQQVLDRGTTTDHMTIRAGQNGVVLRKMVEEGSYVQTGSPLFHVGDLGHLWVLLDAYESDLAWIRLGQNVEFGVEAFPGETFTGKVSFIDPVVDPKTRTVKVRVDVANKDRKLKPDMFVRAQIKAPVSKSGKVQNASLKGKWISPMHPQIVKDKPGNCDICGMPLVKAEELGYVTSGVSETNPLVIPATAPLYTGERSLVYVEVPDTEKPTYEAREIALGPRVDDHYVVKSGLEEGEMVVVNGAFKIDGELQIRAKPSMMNPVAGADDPDMSETPVSGPIDEEFRESLENLVDNYLQLSNALADDELGASKKAFAKVKESTIATNAPTGDTYSLWRDAKKGLVKTFTRLSNVEDIEDARGVFEDVSKEVISLEKHYLKGHGDTRYLAYCPMAFNDKGAYWIQGDQEINNPYFGAQMLKCGVIKDTL